MQLMDIFKAYILLVLELLVVNGYPSWFDEQCSAKMVVAYVTNNYGYSAVVSQHSLIYKKTD